MLRIFNFTFYKILLSLTLFIISFFLPSYLKIISLVLSYIIISYEIYIEAYSNLKKKELFDENFLMIIATLGAFIIKSYEEAVMVMFLFEVGEYLADLAISKSKKSLLNLLNLKKDTITRINNGKEEVIPLKEAQIKDIFIVKPGERIALDGKVVEGNSFIDTSSLTGETTPKRVAENDFVLSGSINETSLLKIEATTTSQTSTAARIMKLLEEVDETKSKTETLLTKFSKIYTPVIVSLALIIGLVFSVITHDYNTWIYRALVFLVTACPCALVISIPLAYFCGIGTASRKGIIIKGSKELDNLNDISYLFLDKTGTLTKGNFQVTKVKTKDLSKQELLEYAASAEKNSIHPIALAIKNYNKEKTFPVKDFTEISGEGISCTIKNKSILVGNKKLMESRKIKVEDINEVGTIIYVAIDNKYEGYIIIADEIKKSALHIAELKNYFKDIIILSGDKKESVKSVAEKLQITTYYGELLPEDKLNYLKKYQKKAPCMFVGDGINDALVMKASTVSVSMGIKGSDASIETSDIVLMNDDLRTLQVALNIAKNTKKKVIQNIIFSLSVKFIVLLLAFLGISTIWMAVFADVGVTFLVIINVLFLFIKNY